MGTEAETARLKLGPALVALVAPERGTGKRLERF